eukprot:15443276-Alexandrium_andersonii.AAC.1
MWGWIRVGWSHGSCFVQFPALCPFCPPRSLECYVVRCISLFPLKRSVHSAMSGSFPLGFMPAGLVTHA